MAYKKCYLKGKTLGVLAPRSKMKIKRTVNTNSSNAIWNQEDNMLWKLRVKGLPKQKGANFNLCTVLLQYSVDVVPLICKFSENS